MPSICRRDVGFPEGSNVGSFEHLLELLDIIDDALNIHPKQYSGARSLTEVGNSFNESFVQSLPFLESDKLDL